MHREEPVTELNVPTLQSEQELAPAVEKVPNSHSMQVALETAAKKVEKYPTWNNEISNIEKILVIIKTIKQCMPSSSFLVPTII